MAKPGKYMTLKLGRETFGMPIELVREIITMVPITKVPRKQHFVKGVINLRGKIVPIVDLRLKFGMPPMEYDRQTSIIVIVVDQLEVGVIVDRVTEVKEILEDQLEPNPDIGTESSQGEALIGVAATPESVIILVDLSRTLSKRDLWNYQYDKPSDSSDAQPESA